MVMEPSLPMVVPARSESRPAVAARDSRNANSSSSIKLLKPTSKPSVIKRSPDLAPKAAPQSQTRAEPARRSVTKLPQHASEKAQSSGTERPRKSTTEKPKRTSTLDSRNKEKQEMEALVRKLSTPNLGAHRPPAVQVPEKAGAKAVTRVDDKSSEAKALPARSELKELAPPQESVSPRLEFSSNLESQSPTQEVLAARKSRNTTPVRRPSNASDAESEDVSTNVPLTPSRIMPLMPVSAIDAMMNDESQGSSALLGPYLIKLTKLYSMEEDQSKAIEYGIRAVRFYEKQTDNGQPSLEFIASLQILAALYGRLGNFDDAIPLLERSVVIPVTGESEDHALAKFSGHMQLGDSFNLLGKQSAALDSYHRALRVQKAMLGDLDPRVGETCHYIAEAHLQVS
jgi:tetratricopeptide (TPR) repeat protein